jgi:UDP-N-acetylglucosamine 1-carboxyvinyltransferase
MRSSVTFLGALLGRFKKAVIYTPGGCALGKRPIDIHLEALKKMGVQITCEEDKIICTGAPVGTELKLRYPSVGATENLVLAAVSARGTTVIKNCAREPEIAAMADFLNMAGAKIKGAGTDKITIEGVSRLNRCEYTVPGDRIESATFLCAAAITGGELFVRGVPSNKLTPIIGVLRGMGCVIKDFKDAVYIDAPKRLSAVKAVVTAPYPAFPTDVQPQITAVLATATGQSCVMETVFEARNKHINELNKMGANIRCESGNCFVINGVDTLKGTQLTAEDLRGGAALTLAALAAEGESRVKNIHYIQRGYEKFEDKLREIGAEIRTI